MIDPFEENDKIIELVQSQEDRPAGRITFACSFVAAKSPGWYVVSVTLAGLPDNRKSQYDVFLYVGESYYDIDRNMTINPRDYFIAEAQDGHDADAILIDKALQYSTIDDVIKFHHRKKQ